jgi:hypothetical protein
LTPPSPWRAIDELRQYWQPNAVEVLIAALGSLPPLTIKAQPPQHRSKVNPQNEQSVIRYFNAAYRLDDLLTRLGGHTSTPVMTCPWHDDRSPSLVRWRHRTGKEVCRCFSAHSNCPAAIQPFLDAFDVYCLMNTLSPSEAVRQIAERDQLGVNCPYQVQRQARRRRIVIYQHNPLRLQDGALLTDSDVIIVDESPLDALLGEQKTTVHELQQLEASLTQQQDPALTLVRALNAVVQGEGHLDGTTLVARLQERLEDGLQQVVDLARQSRVSRSRPTIALDALPEQLPRQFFGDLLAALIHDMEYPNSLVEFDKREWFWYDKRPFLQAIKATPQPAVIVLDGSAHAQVCAQLYAPWPVTVVAIDVPLSPNVTIVQCGLTAATRKILDDPARLMSLTRAVAGVCAQRGRVLDGGIAYKQLATGHFSETLGGTWLHYGGQRGRNDLVDARTIAIIGSPTVPPQAITRTARALWSLDRQPIDATAERAAQGYYINRDARIQAINELYGPQELRQAAHRCRPILRMQPTTLLIFSPWDLASLGLAPKERVTQIPYGNSQAAKAAYAAYQALRREPAWRQAPKATRGSGRAPPSRGGGTMRGGAPRSCRYGTHVQRRRLMNRSIGVAPRSRRSATRRWSIGNFPTSENCPRPRRAIAEHMLSPKGSQISLSRPVCAMLGVWVP